MPTASDGSPIKSGTGNGIHASLSGSTFGKHGAGTGTGVEPFKTLLATTSNAETLTDNDTIGDDEENNEQEMGVGQELQMQNGDDVNSLFQQQIPNRENPLYNTEIRHGFAQDFDQDPMDSFRQIFYLYYENKRHDANGNPKNKHGPGSFPEWRIKDRQRTVCAGLVLCLNIGVDPPDLVKTQPCAKLEAWVDPNSYPDTKRALDQIGKNLTQQYEVLSMRTKYKTSLDPIVDDIKRFCMGLRRTAREERVLFHYNGHGVPRPTPSGEIWVFNRGYTQYIPVTIKDLQNWLGAPCIYVIDANASGNFVNNFHSIIAEKKRLRDEEIKQGHQPPNATYPPEAFENCIQLAACRGNEVLPMHPDLPADLFSCCLTSPISIAVRWFVMQSPLPYEATDLSIPGRISDRKTPLGELNWIFTAITDTIAWSTLESSLFKRLFRQDLVVAALFRNFLLAERIMRVHNCHPVSYPKLPSTHDHPMWDAWDLAIDHCLVQLPALQAAEAAGQPSPYQHSKFFEQQLTAFEYWLKYKSSDLDKPPEQLPVLLQVLLSQSHRLRALILLSKFLDLGPRAVHLALSIGIFPYVLKLLQSPAPELRPVLIFIWARIMAVDYHSVQSELLKDNGFAYFLNLLTPQPGYVVQSHTVYEHMSMCAFIVTLFCRGFRGGQKSCLADDLFRSFASHLSAPESPLLRQWSCLFFSQVWDEYPDAKALAVSEEVIERLVELLEDAEPEVRAACIIALTTFLEDDESKSENVLAFQLLALTNDASPIVRREAIVFFSKFVKMHMSGFLVAAYSSLEEEVVLSSNGLQDPEALENVRLNSPAHGTVYATVWKALLVLTKDPHNEVRDFAQDVVDYVLMALERTPLSEEARSLQHIIYQSPASNSNAPFARAHTSSGPGLSGLETHRHGGSPDKKQSIAALSMTNRAVSSSSGNAIPPTTPPSQSESRFANTLKRSVSFAASLKNYAFGTPTSLTSQQNSSINPAPIFDTPSVTTVPFGAGIKPLPVRYTKRDITRPITLPLESGFFDAACEHFQEPQMSPSDIDEPGSERYLERLWRKGRNESIISRTQGHKDLAVCGDWSSNIAYLNNITQPIKLLYAQFEPHLIACDDRDGVTVWDWTENTKLNRFCNSNPAGTRITEAKLINEDDEPLLLTGSSDGVVKIYRHYQNADKIQLASAWRALSDLVPANKNSGLIAEWQQSRGTLLVGGDVRVIRVWDAPRELMMTDIPARSGSPVTSLTSDQVFGNVILAGFGDGAIRVYDRRIPQRESLIKTWKRHDSWIVNIHMQKGGTRELVSGSTDGMVRLWDIRNDSEPVLEFQAAVKGKMRSMEVHEHAPVIAAGSNDVAIWSTRGVRMSWAKSATAHGSYMLANKSYQVSAIAFHPHRIGLAVNNAHDSHISAYEPTYR